MSDVEHKQRQVGYNLYLLTHSAKNRFHPDIFTFGGILQGQRIGYVRVSSFDQNLIDNWNK
jgi:hypothetical protein